MASAMNNRGNPYEPGYLRQHRSILRRAQFKSRGNGASLMILYSVVDCYVYVRHDIYAMTRTKDGILHLPQIAVETQ